MRNSLLLGNWIDHGLAEMAKDGAWIWTSWAVRNIPYFVRVGLSNFLYGEIMDDFTVRSYQLEFKKSGFDKAGCFIGLGNGEISEA